jgi:hypothetical protein
LAGGKNVSYNQLSYGQTRLNILDVVFAHPSEQYDHVLTLLGLLLDPLGNLPRHFDNAEVAAVRQALQGTYARYDWETELLAQPQMSPTLETFCHQLRQVGEPAARLTDDSRIAVGQAALALAAEIESLYVRGDYAAAFNAPSNLDLRLQEQIVLFDFSQVPERRRALFYYAVLAGINLQIRRHPRRRAIFVDEVHYMNQEASLMDFLAHMVKTVRTYGAAVVMIDQDLEAFIGVEGAEAASMASGANVTAGLFILNNVSWLMPFGSKRDAAYRLAGHFKDELLPAHAEFLARMGSDDRFGKGMAVVLCNGKADKVQVYLRPIEADCLLGS